MTTILAITSFLLPVFGIVDPNQSPYFNYSFTLNFSTTKQPSFRSGIDTNHSLENDAPILAEWSSQSKPDSFRKNTDGADSEKGNVIFAEGQITATGHQTRISDERTDRLELGDTTPRPIHLTMEDKKFNGLKSNVSERGRPEIRQTTWMYPKHYFELPTTDKTYVEGEIVEEGSVRFESDQRTPTQKFFRPTPLPEASTVYFPSAVIENDTRPSMSVTAKTNMPEVGVVDKTTHTTSLQLTWETTEITPTETQSTAIVRNQTDDKFITRRPKIHEILTFRNDSIENHRHSSTSTSTFGKLLYSKSLPSEATRNRTAPSNTTEQLTFATVSNRIMGSVAVAASMPPFARHETPVGSSAAVGSAAPGSGPRSDRGELTPRRRLNETINRFVQEIPWPVKKEAVVEGDIILGGLMMVHEREDSITCGPVMPQGGIQALEAMLFTLDQLNSSPEPLLPNITLGAHILDDCDKDTYGLEMAVDFIKGKRANDNFNCTYSGKCLKFIHMDLKVK